MEYDDVKRVLRGLESFETALIQEDYPYGRKLRCRRAAWVETATKGSKRGQQRFVTRTEHPKTFCWNKPKAGTYSDIIILYLNGEEHVKMACLSTWDSKDKISAFVETFGDYLTEHQNTAIKHLDAVQRVSSRITFTITASSKETASESEKRRKDDQRMINAMLVQELRSPSQEPILH